MRGESPLPLGVRLAGRLQEFLDRLRESGVRAGVAAGVDLSRSLEALPILDRATARDACRATLAKSPGELGIVERVFDEFFGPRQLPVPPPSEEGKVPQGRSRTGRPPPGSVPGRSREQETDPELVGRYSPIAPTSTATATPLGSERQRRFRAGARRFRRSVATLPGRRWRSSPGGRIDLRRTARAGLRSSGEWLELARRDRAARRADLVILWDVSGSMREHTSTLFGLVYALHRTVRRTRVFAFGHELVELTPLFSGRSYERALPMLSDRLSPTGGGTRIAHCLAEFRRHHGSEVRRSSTLVIVSDGWDLGDTRELSEELRRLRGPAHAVVWVNPYAGRPGFRPATAALTAAMPYVDLLTSPDDFPHPHGRRASGLSWSSAVPA